MTANDGKNRLKLPKPERHLIPIAAFSFLNLSSIKLGCLFMTCILMPHLIFSWQVRDRKA